MVIHKGEECTVNYSADRVLDRKTLRTFLDLCYFHKQSLGIRKNSCLWEGLFANSTWCDSLGWFITLHFFNFTGRSAKACIVFTVHVLFSFRSEKQAKVGPLVNKKYWIKALKIGLRLIRTAPSIQYVSSTYATQMKGRWESNIKIAHRYMNVRIGTMLCSFISGNT